MYLRHPRIDYGHRLIDVPCHGGKPLQLGNIVDSYLTTVVIAVLVSLIKFIRILGHPDHGILIGQLRVKHHRHIPVIRHTVDAQFGRRRHNPRRDVAQLIDSLDIAHETAVKINEGKTLVGKRPSQRLHRDVITPVVTKSPVTVVILIYPAEPPVGMAPKHQPILIGRRDALHVVHHKAYALGVDRIY